MKKIVVFTGAGVSADSGIATFRDSDGLWAASRIEEVCTPEALASNRSRVIDFYNLRRRELLTKKPNAAHQAMVSLEQKYKVEVITQNIDDLHERAGSKCVMHLHGELSCLRSGLDPQRIYPIEGWAQAALAIEAGASVEDYAWVWKQSLASRDLYGDLLRPHVVFFGEAVPHFETAIAQVASADILIVVGTSLAVYPAGALVFHVPKEGCVYVVDPKVPDVAGLRNKVEFIEERAEVGMPKLVDRLLK